MDKLVLQNICCGMCYISICELLVTIIRDQDNDDEEDDEAAKKSFKIS